VEICPVEALYFREDGIVDFDNDRCIGCKSCMQACPYDALYIDPESHTAAKCNYCAHRIDVGLEPACVNVCPEHAIISGDMENPESEIATLLARQQVKVRKAEKGTAPNLFYIDADDASLNPTLTEKEDDYLWSSQSMGVGHYAKEAEKMAFSNDDVLNALMHREDQTASAGEIAKNGAAKSIDLVMGKPRRAYDVADKGILWGWEVSGYVVTKAIAAGAFFLPFVASVLGIAEVSATTWLWSVGISLVFLALTGVLLIMDLDRPDRFLNVLLRPQWGSWLVRGGYTITVFGGLMTLLGVSAFMGWNQIQDIAMWLTAPFAILLAIYTAFLFAQAKGRDFWQSPTLSIHMLVHSFMAGAAVFALLSLVLPELNAWLPLVKNVFLVSMGVNLFTILLEMVTTHPTTDAKKVVQMILKGRYSRSFWAGVIVLGNLLPIALLLFGASSITLTVAALVTLIGIYITEHIWVEAPQRIPLS
jgi:formate-dependent nitrite reductase membrane component NrfD/ferredoxin